MAEAYNLLKLLLLTFAASFAVSQPFRQKQDFHPCFFLISSESQPLHETTRFFNSLLGRFDSCGDLRRHACYRSRRRPSLYLLLIWLLILAVVHIRSSCWLEGCLYPSPQDNHRLDPGLGDCAAIRIPFGKIESPGLACRLGAFRGCGGSEHAPMHEPALFDKVLFAKAVLSAL
jgi:hypothetical protein